MTIDQLKFFHAIVKYGTYLEAAGHLQISQSSLSKQIINLEHELNVSLFYRNNRTVRLTEAGEIFYEDSQKILVDHMEMLMHLNSFRGRDVGTVRVGTLPILSQYGLTAKVCRFMEANPGIRVEVEEAEDEELRQGLDHGKYDLAFVRQGMLRSGNYDLTLVDKDRLVVLSSATHALADKQTVALENLKNEKFIMIQKHISVFDLSIQACKEAGVVPEIIRTARIESILDAVKIGEGISLLCEKQISAFKAEGISVTLLKKPVGANILIACRSRIKLSKQVRKFINYISNF